MTYYRRQATTGAEIAYSNTVTISITPSGGTIYLSGPTSIPSGTVPGLLGSGTLPTGGTFTYQWQKSTNNSTWTTISGATATTYQSPAITTTTQFRRMATRSGQSPVYSNVISVSIVQPGSISGDQSISSGATPAMITNTSSASGGAGTMSYMWQSSTNNSTWTTISGATSASYQPGPLNVTTYFRRMTIHSGPSVFSNVVTISVRAAMAFTAVPGVVALSDVSSKTGGLQTYEKVAVLDGPAVSSSPTYVERAFFYDYKGRVIQTAEKNHLGGVSVYSTKYDFAGNVLASHESHKTSSTASADTKLTTFEYDHRGRLLSETTTVNSGAPAVVTYAYDELGKLKSKTLGSGSNAVTENLTYNIQGWLTNQSSDLFEMQLRYFDPRSGASKARRTGDIAEWRWQHKGHRAPTGVSANSYEFTYDGLGRMLSNDHKGASTLTATSWGTPAKTFTEAMTYDRNGNIMTITRQGYNIDTGAAATDQLNLNMSIPSNQPPGLSHNNASGSVDVAGSMAYSYDKNGNLAASQRGNLDYGYNYLNLLGNVKVGSTVKAQYRWLADGTKAGVRNGTAGTQGYEYLGSLVYKRTGASTVGLESSGFAGGRIEVVNGTPTVNYQITDHLGSVRVMFTSKTNVLARNDYYAFGKPHFNSLLPAFDDQRNRFLFNGKENQLTGDLRFLDYGARMYDSELGRWFNPDPLAEKYYGSSPYNYTLNNPIRYVDPFGLDVYRYDDETGEMILVRETDDDFDQIGRFKKEKNEETGKVTYTLKEKRNGTARTRMDKIEKGILRHGMNFKTSDNSWSVGGEGQPTVDGFQDFVISFAEMINKELAGVYLSDPSTPDVVNTIYVGRHIRNTATMSYKGNVWGHFPGMQFNAQIHTSWHTHPSFGYNESDRTRPSGWNDGKGDIGSKRNALGAPHPSNRPLHFIILTRGYAPIPY